MSSHISFSELKVWNDCSYKHKLQYVDKIKIFTSNEHTTFGTAIHETNEMTLLNKIDKSAAYSYFIECFNNQMAPLLNEKNEKLFNEMKIQAKAILDDVYPAMEKYFGEYEVISTEETLMEKINDLDFEFFFKGFIDAVIKTKDGKYHIIDWKTCSWGWDIEKKTAPMTTYQLTFYKEYFAQKHNIDPDMIETHFALLKRTAKKNNVELFKVSSGEKKTKNANTLLTKAIMNINNGKYVKNKLACSTCEFNNTPHCPK
jgi:ATP-dependent exoDNAse (exonuclease V) beta subunit